MKPLSLNTLASLPAKVTRPNYDVRTLPIGVVHFGPGAFHRAHQAAYFDSLATSDPRWGICAVSLQTSTLRDALLRQDGLYTLVAVDSANTYRVIGAIREVLVAAENPQTVLTRLSEERIEIVTTTVTEKGYCLTYDGALDLLHPDIVHDLAAPRNPRSLIGYLVEGLRKRRAATLPPFIVIPCDNLPNNGRLLKAALITYARQFDFALASWIEQTVQSPNTMVDSITPATNQALRDLTSHEAGVADACPVQREVFSQWVIESHLHLNGPRWASVGVSLAESVDVYEKAKLRLLNGSHSLLAYWGILKGYRTVAEAIADEEIATFLKGYMHDDIADCLRRTNPIAYANYDLDAYCEAIVARFRNPAMNHQLAQIAADGSKKLAVRIVAPMIDAANLGLDIRRYCLPIAAWLKFLRLKTQSHEPIVDPIATELQSLASRFNESDADLTLALGSLKLFDAPIFRRDETLQAITEAYVGQWHLGSSNA